MSTIVIAQNLEQPKGDYWSYGIYLMVNRDFYDTSNANTIARIDRVRTPCQMYHTTNTPTLGINESQPKRIKPTKL